MKNYFKKLMALALSVIMVAGFTACNNEFVPDNNAEAKQGAIILDNDFVVIRLMSNEARAITEQVPYTKEDWDYNTTTVTYGGVSATTEFYSKTASINVECKKEGEYNFKSTAYKADKQTIVATSDPVIKNITFENGDFNLIITYTNINSYEVTTGVTGTIENQWDDQEENIAVLSKDWFNNGNAPSKDKIKSITFIKNDYTGSFTNSWSGGENITVYYNSADENIVVSAAGLTIYAPEDCSSLFENFTSAESIDLSNLDTSNVTDMSFMFSECRKLFTLDLSNFDTSNVTSMQQMFCYCESLTSLDLSNFNTSNVTNMTVMFLGCSSLTSLDLSNFDTSKVTDSLNMFYYCYFLEVTYTPATWTLGTNWSGTWSIVTFIAK